MKQTLCAFLLLAFFIAPNPTHEVALSAPAPAAVVAHPYPSGKASAYTPPPKDVEALIDAFAAIYHVDPKLQKAIAWCESQYSQSANHLNKNGTHDVGVMQINDIHLDDLKVLGMDRQNIVDNIHYGSMLLSKNGTSDYLGSAYCWRPILQTNP